jgi:hypothetical protein
MLHLLRAFRGGHEPSRVSLQVQDPVRTPHVLAGVGSFAPQGEEGYDLLRGVPIAVLGTPRVLLRGHGRRVGGSHGESAAWATRGLNLNLNWIENRLLRFGQK